MVAGVNPEFLIIGKGGQLSNAFAEILGSRGVRVGLPEIDLSFPEKIVPELKKYSPKAIINTAAYTAVDKAETEEKLAMVINAESVGIMARFCKEQDIPLVHYSTDYVFSGESETPWKESDFPEPLNAYGRSKLEGEKRVAGSGCKYLIFRTSWVYDHSGKNFLTTMLRLGKEKEKITVVNDQWGAPTYAGHLAEYSLRALEIVMKKPQFPSGIYNMAGSGVTSWYGFAMKIFSELREKNVPLRLKEVVAVGSSEYKTLAKRPSNSRLDMSKLKNDFGIVMPGWEEALKDCIGKI